MNIRRSNMAIAATVADYPEPVEAIPQRAGRTVPEKPTLEMLAAGSAAGGVSVEAAWNIYQAMLKAAP